MIGLTDWKSWLGLALAGALLAATWTASARGRAIERLELEAEALRLENLTLAGEAARLKKAAAAVDLAGRAQGLFISADLARRERIEEIMAGAVCGPDRPKGVIDDEASRKAIELVNTGLGAFGGGLRRP